MIVDIKKILKKSYMLLLIILLFETITLSAFADLSIYQVVAIGNFENVQQLIEKGVDVNAKNELEKTPLYIAAENGNKEIITFLLENGADENQIKNKQLPIYFDSDKNEVITQGVMKPLVFYKKTRTMDGKTEVLVIREDDPNFNLSKNDYDKTKAGGRINQSMSSSYQGKTIIITLETFLEEVLTSETIFKVKEPAIFRALNNRRINTVKNLLGLESNVNIRDIDGNTPLHSSSKQCFSDMSDMLLKRRVKINELNYSGETPLHLSTGCNKEFIIKLLNNGADANIANNHGDTPLFYATKEGRLKVALLLIENEARIDVKNENNMNPLHIASFNGYDEIIYLLISDKTDLNAKDINGNTALHLAASKEHKSVAKILVERGANVNTKNNSNFSPLYEATEKRYPEIVKLLLGAGANPNIPNANNGNTPLHIAAKFNQLEIAKLLIENGADKKAKNFKRKTPRKIAKKRKYKEMAKLLK